MYAMDFRHYMPDIGRFTGMDVLSESYTGHTPYHFTMNNPVNYSDPTGLYTRDANGNITTSNQGEIHELFNYFSGGGSVKGVDNLIKNNSVFAIDLPEVAMTGQAGGGFAPGSYNSAVMSSGILGALYKFNFSVVQYTLTQAVTETKIGQSVAGVENFLFRDIPLSFAGGELLAAGWRASGIGRVLANQVNVLYARIAPKIITEFKPITTLAKYYPEDGGALGNWTTKTFNVGDRIDRYGSLYGKYFSEYGTPMEMRALPPGNTGAYNAFEIIKPFSVQSSNIAPAFGNMGTGVQYYSPFLNANELIMGGYIRLIP